MIMKRDRVDDRGIGPFCSLASGVRKNKYRIDHRQARVGKWETWFWFSTFPLSLGPGCGNVGISRSVRDFQGAVGGVGSLPLAFHAFHSSGISTARRG